MAFEFVMPDIGEGLADGEILGWLVEVGDRVEQDASLVEVETDKAVMVIPAPQAGVLLAQGGPKGTTIRVGDLLAVIGNLDERVVDGGEDDAPAVSLVSEEEEFRPIVGTLEEAPSSAPSHPAARPLAAPPTRKLAKDLGVDLREVRGTGPSGRVTRSDVVEHSTWSGPRAREEQRKPLSGRRKAISAHLSRSWREVPHVTTFGSARAERLLEARSVLSERLPTRVPLEALLIRAVAPVLHAMPEFNAYLDGDAIVYRRVLNVGVSVDAPEGLTVPVVHDADELAFETLCERIASLAESAKERRLTPADTSDLTFTVSNIGAVGGGYGTPIIPFGSAAILSVGRAERAAVVEGEHLAVGLVAPLSLSYDHRLIDGGSGRRFLHEVIRNLEQPLRFLAG